MRQIAQSISDLFAKNAVREVTTTIPPPAKTLKNVLTEVKITFYDPISVKYGKKEKEISKIKVTKNVPHLEAKKIFEKQTPELDFTKIVTSLSAKPESKTIGTQFFESDFTINPSSKVISPSVEPKSQPKPTSVSQSHSNTQSQSNSTSRSDPSRSHSQSSSQSSSQSQSGSQSSSQTSSEKKEKHQSSSGQGSGRR